MPDDVSNLPADQSLMAYADGELTGDALAEMQRRVLANPAARSLSEHEQRLRGAVSRVMSDVSGPTEQLAHRVAALAFEMPASSTAGTASMGSSPSRWFSPVGLSAAAVVLLGIGIVIGRYGFGPSHPGGPTRTGDPIASIPGHETHGSPHVPPTLVSFATRAHVGCSKSPSHHHADLPASIGELDAPIRDYLGGTGVAPDLSSLGYRYVGCGPCGRPTETMVHFLYQSDANAADTLSLFICPFKGQVGCEPGHCYGCGKTDPVNPMLVWRTDKLVFMLVGNNAGQVEKARKALRAPERV